MQKIWIGGYAACGVHNELYTLMNLIESLDLEITDDYTEADIIILIDTCIGAYRNLKEGIKCIEAILYSSKENAIKILSGCMAKGVNFELTKRQKDILSRFTVVQPEDLFLFVSKLLCNHVNEEECTFLPFKLAPYSIKLSPVTGCLNHCAFCKSQYMHFGLKSYPFEQAEELKTDLIDRDIKTYMVTLHSSNLSLYGVDLYGRPRAHEIIRTLSSPDQVKFVFAGALINFYRELIDEILNNEKIKHINISLESGSPRIYKLMNRPVSLEELIKIIKLIRKERPDIIIHTELIAGFPTENEDDLRRSVELTHELDIMPDYVHYYQNSPHTSASLLPQSFIEHRIEARNKLLVGLKDLKDKFSDRSLYGEHVALIPATTENELDEPKTMYVIDTLGNIKLLKVDEELSSYSLGDVIPAGVIKPKHLVYQPKK